MNVDCYTCRSLSGERRISPGPTIYEGRYWLIEHAYPARLKGWLVIILKRHVEALHELTREEFVELGELQALAARLLHESLGCAKEYVACFAEAEHFQHIHFHVVAKTHDLPDEFKGTRIFAMSNASEAEALPREDIKAFCETLKNRCDTSMPCHSERASPSTPPPPMAAGKASERRTLAPTACSAVSLPSSTAQVTIARDSSALRASEWHVKVL